MYKTDIPNYNFEVIKGDESLVTFRYLASGSPADLRGSLVYFLCSSKLLNQKVAMPLPQSGEFTISFDGLVTSKVDMRNLSFKMVRYTQGILGPRTTMFSGNFKLIGDSL